MAMSSEEVLLVVAQVRSRKSNGSLYLMGKRLAWQEDNKEVFTVSHYYADVKRKYKIKLVSVSVHEVTLINFHVKTKTILYNLQNNLQFSSACIVLYCIYLDQ